MRGPVFVRAGAFDPDDWRLPPDATWHDAATLGRELARWLLPPEVWALFGDSMRALGALPGAGVRLRLCLAEELIDLPWEYLYRPDVTAPTSPRSGFLLMDERLSIVREPATLLVRRSRTSAHVRRGVFVGALWSDGSDGWSVEAEYTSLKRSLSTLTDLVQIDRARASDDEAIAALLSQGCDFFAQREYAVSDHILRRESVRTPVVRYRDRAHLISIFQAQILEPAERMVLALRPPLLV